MIFLQQENGAHNPTSTMHGNHIPLIVHHSSPNQLPLVSPPTQEDLWHLPGQLRESNPLLSDTRCVSLKYTK